jgi:hypothetical protein
MVKLPEKFRKRSEVVVEDGDPEEIGGGKRSEMEEAGEDSAIRDPHSELPYQAYAIVPDRDDPSSWKLPHHTRLVNRAVKGKIGYEHTVDWDLVNEAVVRLSRQGVEGARIDAPEDQVLAAAQHLASHYIKAGKPLPDALAVMV